MQQLQPLQGERSHEPGPVSALVTAVLTTRVTACMVGQWRSKQRQQSCRELGQETIAIRGRYA